MNRTGKEHMSNVLDAKEENEETLKDLEYILVIDHSGSMGEPSTRIEGKNRLEEVQEEVISIARTAEKYDADGITVISFSSSTQVYDGVTTDRVKSVFAEFPPRGGTNLTAAINEVIRKTRSSSKEVVALVYTDGKPDNQQSVIEAVNAAGKEFGRPKIAFAFIQVGNDTGAKQFLEYLDDNLSVDVSATIPEERAENFTFPQIVWLARNA